MTRIKSSAEQGASVAEKEKKKTTATPEQIADFLQQTGFVFEMRAREKLVKFGYTCDISYSFLDLDGDLERELYIVASKFVNGINVHLVIECKQSLIDKSVFICTKSGSSRYYYGVKHLPQIPQDTITECFKHLHALDFRTPLAHNYIAYSSVTEKKSDNHLPIDECVHKLPKALLDVASYVKGGKHIFFPVTLFAGQLFSVTYKGALKVEERSFLQYYSIFKSRAYRRPMTDEESNVPHALFARVVQWDEKRKQEREAN